MKINIWSDIACPYCYIGLKKLEKALTKLNAKDEINIEWHSYELSPNLPMASSGKTHTELMIENGMSESEINANHKDVVTRGKAEGIKFNFDKVVTANTSKALRLVKLASEEKLGTEAEKALFKAYFEDGKDVSSNDVLISIASGLSIDTKKVKDMLASDKFAQEVKDDTSYANDTLDIEFIPYFVFNNKNKIEGAVETEEFYNLLEKSYNDWKINGEGDGEGETTSGQSCSIDGVCS